MSSCDTFLGKWGTVVRRAANFVCRDFPDVEKSDVLQHLYAFVLEEGFTDPEESWIPKVLCRSGTIFAWDQRKEHLQLSCQYSYRTSDVRHILETVFEMQDWSNVRVPDDAKSEFNDVFMELNSDIKRAWESLGHAQKKVIFERYALGWEPETAADKKRLWRAIVALTDSVNWYKRPRSRDFVGTRRAITNAHARADISHLED